LSPPAPGPLERALRAKRDLGRKLLVTYVTGGLGPWVDLLRAMADAGADAIEVGIPFSDPVMDGPTIQEASSRALAGGATPFGILTTLEGLELPVPLVAMTYYNIVARAGHQRFCGMLSTARVSAAIVPDLPLEESAGWEAEAAARGVETVLLAAPVTPAGRLDEICRRSRGFVYGVNLMGTTGERDRLAATAAELASRLKQATDKPIVMGFGISTPSQAVKAAGPADGVVVASALMRLVLDGGANAATVGEVAERVAAMRAALDKG
jgi:tryptophan synthase alpha chain